MNPVNIDKVKNIVDTLVKGKVVDKISETMDHGFGDVTFKITVQNGAIRVITLTETQTVKVIDGMM